MEGDFEKARQYFLNDFLAYLSVERGLSVRTLDEYKKDLRIFLEYFGPHFTSGLTLSSIDERTVRDFLSYLKVEKGYTPRAVNRKIACLKSFFKFLEKEGHLPNSPMRDVKTLKQGRHLPRVLTQQEMGRLLDEAEQPPTGLRPKQAGKQAQLLQLRDRAILEMFYATGVRISELIGMEIEDMDFDNLRIRVLGKGDKERVVLMNENCAEAVKTWLGARPAAPTRALFTSRIGRRISPRAVEYLVGRHLQNAEIYKSASPHTLRHSFGTHMVEGGADLMVVKELLGHENLQTTQIYVNIAMQHVSDVYHKTHPRAQGDAPT